MANWQEESVNKLPDHKSLRMRGENMMCLEVSSDATFYANPRLIEKLLNS